MDQDPLAARAFLAGFQAGAEYPDDSGDGDAMYQHYRDWREAQQRVEAS